MKKKIMAWIELHKGLDLSFDLTIVDFYGSYICKVNVISFLLVISSFFL